MTRAHTVCHVTDNHVENSWQQPGSLQKEQFTFHLSLFFRLYNLSSMPLQYSLQDSAKFSILEFILCKVLHWSYIFVSFIFCEMCISQKMRFKIYKHCKVQIYTILWYCWCSYHTLASFKCSCRTNCNSFTWGRYKVFPIFIPLSSNASNLHCQHETSLMTTFK